MKDAKDKNKSHFDYKKNFWFGGRLDYPPPTHTPFITHAHYLIVNFVTLKIPLISSII